MYKRFAMSGLLMILCFSIVSCGWASILDNHRTHDTKGLIKYSEENQTIQYDNTSYRKDNHKHFTSVAERTNLDDLIFLTWHSDFPFTYDFYSYKLKSPDFILEVGIDCNIWFSETYDYMNDVFVIEDSETEIVFEKVLASDTVNIFPLAVKEKTLHCHSKTHPILKTTLNIFSFNGDYYMCIGNENNAHQLSSSFKEMLINNSI